MNKEQWQRIEQIFYAAMELPCEERDAFVSQACAGDEQLQREVQALLAANREAESFLDSPVNMPPHSGTFSPTLIMPHPTANAGAAAESGLRIGAYRLIREIGRGGMGAVWLAERADGQFYQQVAVKLLHAVSENEEVIRRFRHERQILASLDHPNIARLLDGGTTEDGRPYFVMEYIEGLPIDEYCRQHQLSVDDRLKLFCQVCAAVHYAHQNLVIHRDLKPSNIAVTADGTPKLLDFGIAKLIQPDLSRSYDTLSGVTPMTPAYASPEQVRGEKLTTASDVYSLGVVLYELLTGRSPYRLKAQVFGELMRAVVEQEPERPSTAITRSDGTPKTNPITIEPTEKLRRRLSGDIDSIVLMALRKEPPSRYGSVEQFSEDLRRYLEGLPTVARRGTFGYRAVKYIRRNKVPVAAAALVLLSLLVGIGSTLRQARIANAEKSEAQSQRNRAEAALTTAEERRQQAESARTEADQQRDEAEAQRNEADEQREIAEEQRLRAESQEQSNRRLLYNSQMALANTAWNESNVERVRELLTAHIPKFGESDLRGFEWHYLWRISHNEIVSLPVQTGSLAPFAFSPSGDQLLTLTRGKIKAWDTSNWQEETSLIADNLAGTNTFFISTDGELVASQPDSAREIWVWQVATGRRIARVPISDTFFKTASRIAISAGSMTLASGQSDGQIKVFKPETGKELSSFQSHRQIILSLAYSPDGTRLLAGDFEGNINLWDVRSGKELLDSRNASPSRSVAYSPDGRFFAGATGIYNIRVWDATIIKELKTFVFDSEVMSLRFSPDGKKLVAGFRDRQIRIWETKNWRELTILKGHGNPVHGLAFSPDGNNLASASSDGTVKIWELKKLQTPLIYCGGKTQSHDVAFTPDGRRLVIGTWDQTINVWDLVTGQSLHIFRHVRNEKKVQGHFRFLLTANGKKLVSSGDDGFIFWDLDSGQKHLTIPAKYSSSFALSPDERLLVARPNDAQESKLIFWDVTTGNELFESRYTTGGTIKMVFLPDNRTLVIGGTHLIFWNFRSRQEIKRIDLNGRIVAKMRLSPNRSVLAVSFMNGLIGLYDLSSGREILILKGHGDEVHGLNFSPDGLRLASSSNDHTIRVWDLISGQEMLRFQEPFTSLSVAFSPDGRSLATVGYNAVSKNGYSKLWSAVDLPSVKPACW